jgi:penicillin-binding protein 1A
MVKVKKSAVIFLSLLFVFSGLFGGILGWALSETQNIKNTEYFTEFNNALPTKLLDINGELITDFSSD